MSVGRYKLHCRRRAFIIPFLASLPMFRPRRQKLATFTSAQTAIDPRPRATRGGKMPEKKSPPLKASAVKGAASKESNRDAPASSRRGFGGAKEGAKKGAPLLLHRLHLANDDRALRRQALGVVAAAVDHHCQVAHCWVVVRLYILPQELRQGRDLIRHREGRATCGVWIPNRFCLTLISSLYGNFDNGRHTFSTNMVKQSQRLLQIGVLSNSRIAASGSCLSLEPFIEPREDSRNRLIREKQPIRVAQRQVTERCSASGLTRRNRLCRPTVHC